MGMLNSKEYTVNVHTVKKHVVRENGYVVDGTGCTGVCQRNKEICVEIYMTENCFICEYAYEVAAWIRSRFPQVAVRMINLSTTDEEIPDAVFATPTYLLNGHVWSLGNPSLQQVTEKLQGLLQKTDV
jgi:alkyl hydroperoxide reductase subunit AhpF